MNIFEIAEKLSSNDFNFDKEKCLRKNKASNCTKCIDSCPKEALSIKLNKVNLLKDKCDACAVCICSCPNRAFSFDLDINKIIVDKTSDESISIFSCVKSKQKNSFKVKCLAMLEESTLTNVVIEKGSTLLICDECSNCSISDKALPIIDKKIELTNNLLALITKNSSNKVEIIDKPVIVENFLNRRDLFKKIASKINFVDSSSTSKETKYDDKAITKNQKDLIALVKKNTPAGDAAILNLPFYQATISKDCNYCQKCTKFCPTGALYGGVESSKAKIFFKMKNCNGCNLCSDVCEKNCIDLSDKVQINNLNKEATLLNVNVKLCSMCKNAISTDSETCQQCLNKEGHNKNITTIFG